MSAVCSESPPVPAEHTIASSGPSSRSARSTASSTERESVASPGRASTPSSSRGWRSNEATRAPRSRSRATVAAPMPLAPPVTRATRPEKSSTAQRSTCVRPPSASWRSRPLSGTWSSGTGASASKNVTPPAECSSCSTPRLTQTTSPGPSSRVSSPIVIVTVPSTTAMSCSVCSWAWRLTSLPGSYCTRHSRTWSPPMACRRTPSTNSKASRPFQVRNGEGSGIHAPEAGAAVGADLRDGELLVEDHALALAPRLGAGVERAQDALRGRGHLRHPHAHGVVDRRGDGGRLGVVRHLADGLGPERPFDGRVLEDDVVDGGQGLQRGRQVGPELLAAVLDRRGPGVGVLEQAEAESHHGPAVDLTLDQRRVDRAPDVVHLRHLQDRDLAGLVVDLDLDDARRIGDRRVRLGGHRSVVVVDLGQRLER